MSSRVVSPGSISHSFSMTRLPATSRRVVEVAPGPHGVVVTIDAQTGAVTITTTVGTAPNGITYRDAQGPVP